MKFTKPVPFFVAENQVMFGHAGGGILSVGDHVLYSTGDCLPYGLDGDVAPQKEDEGCGKILLINTKKKGKYKVVGKGVRNSQQFQKFVSKEDGEEYLAFSDIGGVTREEVNAVKLKDLLKKKKGRQIPNFGWGISSDTVVDGIQMGREGSMIV